MYRQLTRLEEEGLQIIRVPIDPDEDFVNRIVDEMDNKTSAIMLSRVYFETSLVNTHLSEIAAEARIHGIPLLLMIITEQMLYLFQSRGSIRRLFYFNWWL